MRGGGGGVGRFEETRQSYARRLSAVSPFPASSPSPCDPSTSGSSMTLLTVFRENRIASWLNPLSPAFLRVFCTFWPLHRPMHRSFSSSYALFILFLRRSTGFTILPFDNAFRATLRRRRWLRPSYVTLRSISGTFCLTNGPCPSPPTV